MENINALGLAKLLLDIQAPSLEDCWSEGFEMAANYPISANPYEKSTSMNRHWSNGWWAAYQESDTVSTSESTKQDKHANYTVTSTLIRESLQKAANNEVMHEKSLSAKNT